MMGGNKAANMLVEAVYDLFGTQKMLLVKFYVPS